MPETIPSEKTINGLHHVTAITSDAQKNIDFYTGLLGLRLVKLTVNFDDPRTYHLYYGDELGRPGTILTFFAWPGIYPGRVGPPAVTTTALTVPKGSLDFWKERLEAKSVATEAVVERFGEKVLGFSDFDGMKFELVETASPGPGEPRKNGGVPVEHGISGCHSVAMSVEGYEHSASLLTETMGFTRGPSDGNRFRYFAGEGKPGQIVDVLCTPDARHGGMGGGVVHHVAWRVKDDAAQAYWLKTLRAAARNVSPVMDRNYFHSIYFREPGGVLFEIATDSPGFAVDEPVESLGKSLKLPAQYESAREQLVKVLPKVKLD